MLLDVQPPQDVLHAVDGPREVDRHVQTELGEPAVLALGWLRWHDPPQSLHLATRQQPPAVQPQQFAELIGVAAIRLPRASFLGLNQHHFATTELGQQLREPIMEAANLEDRNEAIFAGTSGSSRPVACSGLSSADIRRILEQSHTDRERSKKLMSGLIGLFSAMSLGIMIFARGGSGFGSAVVAIVLGPIGLMSCIWWLRQYGGALPDSGSPPYGGMASGMALLAFIWTIMIVGGILVALQ